MRVILSARKSAQQEAKNFGVCVQTSAGIDANVADLKANWVRAGLRWTWAESTQGTYNWSSADTAVTACEAIGVSMLGIISNAPTWAQQNTSNSNGPIKPENIQNYYDFCTALATRFRGRVKAYEIWNEPQGNGWIASTYASLLIIASAAIKAVDPAAIVVGFVANGTFADANSPTHNAWYLSVLDTPGVLEACNEISVHLYCRPYAPDVGDNRGPIPTRLDNSATLLASRGWTRPLWATEGGWPTQGTTPGVVTEAQQAEYIVRLAQICADRGILYFPFQLHGSVTTDEAGGMGLLRPDNTRKPSFDAYRDWIVTQ